MKTGAVHPEKKEKTPSRRELNKQIQKTLLVPFIGCFGALVAESVYPLLDSRVLNGLVAVVLLLPFAVHITEHEDRGTGRDRSPRRPVWLAMVRIDRSTTAVQRPLASNRLRAPQV